MLTFSTLKYGKLYILKHTCDDNLSLMNLY